MSWKYDGTAITEAKYNGTAITKGKYNGVEFFGTTPGGALYQRFVDSGQASVLHGTFTVGRTTDIDRNVFWPGDSDPIGTIINSHVPDTYPNMPERLRVRTSGGHQGRMTHSFASGSVNPGTWMFASNRYWFLCTIGTSPDGSHEWVRLATGNVSSAGRIGGSTWANIYDGLTPAGTGPDHDDRVNPREDLVGGYIDDATRTASLGTAQVYRTWFGREVRLEGADEPVEFVLAFTVNNTIDPNA